MNGVRFREDGFEGVCEGCHEWYPIDQEFWPVWRGFRFCRACYLETRRLTDNNRAEYNRHWKRCNPEKVEQYRIQKNARARQRHYERTLLDPGYVAGKRKSARSFEKNRRQVEEKRTKDRVRMAARRAAIRAGMQAVA